MEASLLESLRHKLDDLEHTVQTFRQHRLADFHRFCHDLLRHEDPAVVAAVHRAIALSFAHYPALRPELDSPPPQPDHPAEAPPIPFRPDPPQAAFGDSPAPSSPHEREKEFQGLFTPSYLPLLESSPALARSPPGAPPAANAAVALGPSRPPESASPGFGADQAVVDMDGPSDAGGVQGSSLTPERPRHVRRSTDDTTSSAAVSDRSDSKPARSALRRSSGSNKPPQSPRRVRFEFMGAEVLPTSSPQASTPLTPDPLLPAAQSDTIISDLILGVGEEEKDDRPPPKKTSSSDALRALSRTPLEDTVWTVVNSDADEGSANRDPLPIIHKSSPKENIAPRPIAPQPGTPIDMPDTNRQLSLGSVHEEPEPEPEEEEEDSSDEEFLAMGKPKSFANKKAIRSPRRESPTRSPPREAPSAKKTENKKKQLPSQAAEADDDEEEDEDYDDDDELFQFETGGLTAPPRPRPRPPPKEEPLEDESLASPDDAPGVPAATYATSPAVTIAARPRDSSGPPTPTTARFQAGSLGSYKGRPVVMPVVRNPEVHAQAASLGQFNTFVGGLDGRSGMDEGDLNSFRASVPQAGFSGTPRSFTERYMMEEAAALRDGSGSDTPR